MKWPRDILIPAILVGVYTAYIGLQSESTDTIYTRDVPGEIGIHERAHYNPRWSRALQSADDLIDSGQYAAAEDIYRGILEKDPDDVETNHCLGSVLVYQSRYSEAESFYQKALSLNPYRPNTNSGLGAVRAYLGDYEKAIEYYERAIQLDNNHSLGHLGLGENLVRIGRIERAKYHLERVIILNPNSFLAGRAQRSLDRINNQIEGFNEASF